MVAADEIKHQQGERPIIVCDSTLLGPLFQQPIERGVDIVLYSLTKYIGEHTDLVAGAAIGAREFIDPIRRARSAFGTQLDSHSSWLIGRSLETVSLRMRRATESASLVSAWLAAHPRVEAAYHPGHVTDDRYQQGYERQCSGAGSTFSFALAGDRTQAFAAMNKL